MTTAEVRVPGDVAEKLDDVVAVGESNDQ